MNSADTDTDITQSYIDLLFQVLLGDEPLSSRKVLVGVEERHDEEKEPDNMVYVVTKLGANVTLNCTDDDQVESVTWSREAVGDIEHVDRMLPLIHVDKNHSGVYTCSVSGSDKIRHVSLLVEHSPEIETRHSHVFARLGDNTQLSCDIAAAPVPAVAWRHDHNSSYENIESNDRRWITIQDYGDGEIISSLSIRNVSTEDFGKYSCVAENSEGQVADK